jgi:hypothetical protein
MKPQRTPKEILIIAAIAVSALMFLCASIALAYNINAPAQAASLPDMPTYVYSTSTPVSLSSAAITPQKTTQPLNKIETRSAVPLANTPTPYEPFMFIIQSAVPLANTPIPNGPLMPVTQSAIPWANKPIPNGFPAFISNCRNILYPVKRGQIWNYQASANSHSGDVRMAIIADRDSRGLIGVANQPSTLSGGAYVTCDRDVILNSLVLNAKGLLGGALNGTVKADYVSGVLAPNESAFTRNNWALSWSTSYRIHGSGLVNYHGYIFSLRLNPFDMRMNCQTLASGAAAFEKVTVSAGTFNSLKVICTMHGFGTGILNRIPIIGSISEQSTQWFAPYIGLVKMQSNSVNIKIFGVTIPFGPNSLSEQATLLNFVQSP